jgi:hypothetical protein
MIHNKHCIEVEIRTNSDPWLELGKSLCLQSHILVSLLGQQPEAAFPPPPAHAPYNDGMRDSGGHFCILCHLLFGPVEKLYVQLVSIG